MSETHPNPTTTLTHQQKAAIHAEICEKLVELSALFKPGVMHLTFLARNTQDPKGHILVSSEDDTSNISKAVQQLMDQTDATVFP